MGGDSLVPRNRRNNNLWYRYGITEEDYDNLFSMQGGVCYICTNPPGKHRLSVDHDHKSGRIRGLLCHNCNHALGKFKDNISLLLRAVKYLIKRR